MSKELLYPLVLKPVFKEYLWGGTNLKKIYDISTAGTIAESWVLSCHPEGVSTIENGLNAGEKLDHYISVHRNSILGNCSDLPILIKMIDAADNLSIQVHPDNCYATDNENQSGKKEMWYIINCDPGAALFYGFRRKLSVKEFKQRAKDGTILEVLNCVPVKQGDVFFIDAGVVHAIGKGMTIAEIGSNCNITYRIFDFMRVDKTGRHRELHLDKAADVALLDTSARHSFDENGCLDCGDFIVHEIRLSGAMKLIASPRSFHSLLCVHGCCRLYFGRMHIDVKNGTSILIPAGIGEYNLQGEAVLLKTNV